MCSFPILLSRGLGILLGAVVTTTAYGQQNKAPAAPEKAPPPGSVHRMVIREGPNQRVYYIATGNLSTSDRMAAHNLEQTENGLIYARDLQGLKQQYVNSERILEPKRRAIQQELYGQRIQYGSRGAAYSSTGGYGGGGYYGYPYGYYPFFNNGWGGGYGYGGYAGGVFSSFGSTSYSVVRSLQFGMGNEGVMKNALVRVIAQEATSSNAAGAVRDYEDAAARAASSPILSRDLGLSKSAAPASAKEMSFAKGSKTTIWVGKDKYSGTVKDDRPGWVVIQTDKGEVTIRKSEITRKEVPPKP
ncbi:MAG TPA: hypothetical protein VMG10_23680 [Gemmataceae bacterium]|nr:hypothetical protein [Gemmataceae bacterium]